MLGTITQQVTEKKIEGHLIKMVSEMKGHAYKFNSEQRRGVPDRICVLPKGLLIFVECKRPGGEPTPAQYREMARLRALGQNVTWVSTTEEVDTLMQSVKRWYSDKTPLTLRS